MQNMPRQNSQVQTQGRFWDTASKNASPDQAEVARLITALLSPADVAGRSVLDAGCGNGDYAAWFAEAGAAQALAFDVSPRSLITARGKAPVGTRFDVAQASLCDLPLDSESVDTLWSWGVLHYVPDPQAALHEIGRVLKPEGIAILHTLGANFWAGMELTLQRVISHSPRPIQALIVEAGTTAIPLATRLRTGKSPEAHTSKPIRQKLQERFCVPGQQTTFTLSGIRHGLGDGFSVVQAHPPVADLFNRDMSLTVIIRKHRS